MSRDGRGSTHPGRPARLPEGPYTPEADPVTADRTGPGGLIVHFHGEDGREASYDVGSLPLPKWHQALAEAWAKRVGPDGTLRTLSSATGPWGALIRLMRFLAKRPRPPVSPAQLTRADLEAYHDLVASRRRHSWEEMRVFTALFETSPLRELVRVEVHDYLRTPTPAGINRGKPSYSDAELKRIIAAARSDAASIRDRIRRGRALVERWQSDRESLTGQEATLAEQLAVIAGTGELPDRYPNGEFQRWWQERLELAGNLFVTRNDMAPLMFLLVVLTSLNAESVKELPAEHRVLESQAVEVQFVKRRGGIGRWNRCVTWEIGPPGRELSNPGGFYLLLHELMAPSRTFAGSTSLWAIWRNGHRDGVVGVAEHYGPFDRALSTLVFKPGEWAKKHGLVADGDPPGQPLVVTMQRLRTTMEIRRTKQMGGHLPSAARTNTMHTLFQDYLRGDPLVIDWSAEVVTDALKDAEQAALDAHHRALTGGRGSLDVDTTGTASGEATAWAECKDPDYHPATGKPCATSFLDCFHCGNCLITPAHLPRLLALLDAFDKRRQLLGEKDWWLRYGPAWAAIRNDVLTRFTSAQVEHARAVQPDDALLDLVETPWEKP